jgi:hypothetical protein
VWSDGKTTQSIQALNGGTYFVSVTTDYCSTTKATYVINGCVGIKENLENGVRIKLFPNPASTIVNIELAGVKSETTRLRIIDLLGNEVSSSVFNSADTNNSLRMDVSALASGVYLFEVKNGESFSTYRLVVE